MAPRLAPTRNTSEGFLAAAYLNMGQLYTVYRLRKTRCHLLSEIRQSYFFSFFLSQANKMYAITCTLMGSTVVVSIVTTFHKYLVVFQSIRNRQLCSVYSHVMQCVPCVPTRTRTRTGLGPGPGQDRDQEQDRTWTRTRTRTRTRIGPDPGPGPGTGTGQDRDKDQGQDNYNNHYNSYNHYNHNNLIKHNLNRFHKSLSLTY